jgi:hypothetical protein
LITDEKARKALAVGAGQSDLRRWDAASMAAQTLAAYGDLRNCRSSSTAVGEGQRRFAAPTIDA